MSEATSDTAGEDEVAGTEHRIEDTAIHEAGHAVAIKLGRYQNELHATIVPKPGENTAGYAKGWEEEGDADEAEQVIFIAAAGYAALRVTGASESVARWGAWGDFERIEELADRWALPGLEHHLQAAVERMSPPQVVAAVRAVADALLEHQTVGGDWLERRIEYAMGEFGELEWAEYEHLFLGSGGTVAGYTDDASNGLAFENEHTGAERGREMDDKEWAACWRGFWRKGKLAPAEPSSRSVRPSAGGSA